MYPAYILQRLLDRIFHTNNVGSFNMARPRLGNFGCRIPHYQGAAAATEEGFIKNGKKVPRTRLRSNAVRVGARLGNSCDDGPTAFEEGAMKNSVLPDFFGNMSAKYYWNWSAMDEKMYDFNLMFFEMSDLTQNPLIQMVISNGCTT